MRTSNAGKRLIKKWEGLKLSAYLDPVGIPTIGYGHTAGVHMGDTITRDEADALLDADLIQFENQVNQLISSELTQNQFDALVSFTYNLGAGNLHGSTLRQKVNIDPFDPSIPDEFKRWNRAGGQVLNGLVKRREEEAALYAGSKKKDTDSTCCPHCGGPVSLISVDP